MFISQTVAVVGTFALFVLAVIVFIVVWISTSRPRRRDETLPAPYATPAGSVDTSLEGLEVTPAKDAPTAALLAPLKAGEWMPPETPAPAEELPSVQLETRIAEYEPPSHVTEPGFAVDSYPEWHVPSASLAEQMPADKTEGAGPPEWAAAVPDVERPSPAEPETAVAQVPAAHDDDAFGAEIAALLPSIPPEDVGTVPPSAVTETVPVAVQEAVSLQPAAAVAFAESATFAEPEPAPAAEIGIAPPGVPVGASDSLPASASPVQLFPEAALSEPQPEPIAPSQPAAAALPAEPLLEPVVPVEPAVEAVSEPPAVEPTLVEPTPEAQIPLESPLAAPAEAMADEEGATDVVYWERELAAQQTAQPSNHGNTRTLRPAVKVAAAPSPDELSPEAIRPPVSRPARARAVVRVNAIPDDLSAEASHTRRVPAPVSGMGSPTKTDVPDLVLETPVEMWFGTARVGVKPGSATYERFRKYADVLLEDLNESRSRADNP